MLLDAERTRAELDSPTYLGGVLDAHGTAMVEPARLAWGLRQACLTPASSSTRTPTSPRWSADGAHLTVRTGGGSVAPTGWRWRRTRSRRCCGGSG